MDEKEAKDAVTGAAGVAGEDEIVRENEEGDEELLERLMKANEAIDTLEQ